MKLTKPEDRCKAKHMLRDDWFCSLPHGHLGVHVWEDRKETQGDN